MSSNLTARSVQKEDTKRKLKKAALDLFAKKGIEHTQIKDITKKAKVAHGTFYVHFESKEEIIDQELKEFNESMVKEFMLFIASVENIRTDEIVSGLLDIYFKNLIEQKKRVIVIAEKILKNLSIENVRDGVNHPAFLFLNNLFNHVANSKSLDLENIPYLTHAILAMWLRISFQGVFNSDANIEQSKNVLRLLTLNAIETLLPGISEEVLNFDL